MDIETKVVESRNKDEQECLAPIMNRRNIIEEDLPHISHILGCLHVLARGGTLEGWEPRKRTVRTS